MNNSKKNYKLYIEIMRILAIFFVIFNHTGNNGFFLFSIQDPKTIRYWIYLFISIFCKFSVPLFFAISGSLLLKHENESLKTLYKKRISKIFITLLIFSFISYLFQLNQHEIEFNINDFFIRFFETNWNVSYWYLYAFIPFLMILPFLRALVKNLRKEDFYYLIALSLFFSFITISQFLLYKGNHTLNIHLQGGLIWITNNIFLYPCIGFFLDNYIDYKKLRTHHLYSLWLINIITILLSCYMTFFKYNITGECSEATSQTFHSTFVMINCITIFITIKYICEHINFYPIFRKLIISVGRCTFGIYLIHMIVMGNTGIGKIWEFFHVQLQLNYMMSAFFYCFIIMIICYFITVLLKKIPILKKLL